MENAFYGAYDCETRSEGHPRPGDYRTPFQIDRDRILHTSAFRRLQSKTQVFLAGEYDVYRTRLTHSLEVAQIGRAICHRLLKTSPELGADFFIDPDLVEAACLAHDIGHPPFGHCGERTLHSVMQPFGGFEGNAQTLRLLTQLIYHDERAGQLRGMDPTRAFADSVLKYKTLFSECPSRSNHFLYDDQEPWLAFVYGDCWPEIRGLDDRSSLRSIECQIMDWADDTAYSLNDLMDGIQVGFITLEKVERWAEHRCANPDEAAHLAELLAAIRGQRVERMLGRKIGDFIAACQLVRAGGTPVLAKQSNRYAFGLEIADPIAGESELYKRLALEIVFRSPELQQLDYKGDLILRTLFSVLSENHVCGEAAKRFCGPLQLVPLAVKRFLENESTEAGRARIICDHLASMTDRSATRTYRRLLDPEFGSITDLV